MIKAIINLVNFYNTFENKSKSIHLEKLNSESQYVYLSVILIQVKQCFTFTKSIEKFKEIIFPSTIYKKLITSIISYLQLYVNRNI